MIHPNLRSPIVLLVLAVTQSASGVDDGVWNGSAATRSRITVVNLDGSLPKVVFDSPRRYLAPEWSPDSRDLIVNGGGKLWRLPAAGGTPKLVPTGSAPWIDINHALSPDGTSLVFTAGGSLWKTSAAGGNPTSLISGTGNYVHGWAADGKWLLYSSNRGHGTDLFRVSADGVSEVRLTTSPRIDDAGQFSPDGRWVYFLSDRGGTRDIWRMPMSKTGANESKAEQITSDDREDAAPHPSPDGKWLFYLSYHPRTNFNATDRDILIRRLPLGGNRTVRTKPVDIARIVGGHGTLGSRPFSPDGRRLVYASFEPPPPTIRFVFFTASDRSVPAGVPQRLTRIADAAERFLFSEMKRWGYPPSVSRLFRRNSDGTVEITYVKSDHPAADPVFQHAECNDEALDKAKKQLRLEGDGHILWTFAYVGDRPQRFSDWRGHGWARDGGSAIVNYDTIPGEIRPDLGLDEGFNNQYYLKATIHELGHALGLSHVGPDPALGMGNSLMGPNQNVYIERKQANADKVYLNEEAAAILWKHPVFSGTAKDRQRQPSVKLINYKPTYSRSANRITLTGKLVADMHAHSIVVVDDLGKPKDDYWYRSHAARIASDGTFRVTIDNPARADGHFYILFCFDNGMVTGDGAGVVFGDRGDIRKSYHFRDGSYRFGD